MISPRERLIVALDVSSSIDAQKIVTSLGESVQIYKVGLQLYTAEGPQIVRDLVASGRRVFLDLKYYDIPNTVAAAVREAAQLGVSMLTVHASGGTKMVRAATEAARSDVKGQADAPRAWTAEATRTGNTRTKATRESGLKVLAVTVLTSMGEQDVNEIGIQSPLSEQVVRLASLALRAGCHGVVSSAQEARALRGQLGSDLLIVTPGVRPTGAVPGDQARVVTPAEAITAGATHIVVGRPITAAKNPAFAADQIQLEIETTALAR
jgi:orotidine-5'-phosphate decarboxylase